MNNMHYPRQKPIFENRYDAGRQLAEKLAEYRKKPVVVMAIPNGGVAVGLQVATALQADLDLIISRKIPLPLAPEGGCGAVTDDGTIILNEGIVKGANLTREQIDDIVSEVKASIRQRSLLYHKDRPLVALRDKTVIVVDDGLASGFTMMAALESVRRRGPRQVIAAAPVGSAIALKNIGILADRIVTCAVGSEQKFYLADFYQYWHEPGDDEVMRYLEEHLRQRSQPDLEPNANGIEITSRPRPYPRLH
ncbi:MAG: phosphoribosyltransferase family protein [Dehalococcoidales bacterium]|nr:phosphoribosyltransferase family protein [Dehalococcoidales bacterium]